MRLVTSWRTGALALVAVLMGLSGLLLAPAQAAAPAKSPSPLPLLCAGKTCPVYTINLTKEQVLHPPSTTPTKGMGVTPQTATIPATCLNGMAYYLPYWTNGGWNQFAAANWNDPRIGVQLAQFWCPRWAGDGVGVRFSGIYYAPYTACLTILVGYQGYTGSWFGAALTTPVAGREWMTTTRYDGLGAQQVYRCPGGHLWDFSQTVSTSSAQAWGLVVYEQSYSGWSSGLSYTLSAPYQR